MRLTEKVLNWLVGPPKTGAYAPFPTGLWGQAPRDLPLFTFQAVRMMLWDPTLRLGIAMREAPLLNAEFAYKDGDKWIPGVEAESPEIGKFVEDQMMKLWRFQIHKLIRSQLWGWAAAEVLFEIDNDRRIGIKGLMSRRAEDVRALEFAGTAQLAGVRFRKGATVSATGTVDMMLPKAVWHAYMPEDGNHYGYPILRGAYSSWCDKWLDGMALDVRRLFMHKDAYGGEQIGYPPGVTDIDGKGNVPNRDIAREIVEQAKAGNVKTKPNVYDDKGNPLWTYEKASVTANPVHILQYPKDLDLEMMRGIEIPDDVLLSGEGSSGAWNGKMIPQAAFYTGLDKWLHHLVADVDQQIIKQIVEWNFGPNRFYRAITKPLAVQAQEQTEKSGGEKQTSQGMGGFDPYGGQPQQMGLLSSARQSVAEALVEGACNAWRSFTPLTTWSSPASSSEAASSSRTIRWRKRRRRKRQRFSRRLAASRRVRNHPSVKAKRIRPGAKSGTACHSPRS